MRFQFEPFVQVNLVDLAADRIVLSSRALAAHSSRVQALRLCLSPRTGGNLLSTDELGISLSFIAWSLLRLSLTVDSILVILART